MQPLPQTEEGARQANEPWTTFSYEFEICQLKTFVDGRVAEEIIYNQKREIQIKVFAISRKN